MDVLKSLQKMTNEAEELLRDNLEWIERYSDYAKKILSNNDTIKKVRSFFYEPRPLYVYSSISRAKNAENERLVTFDLRYRGQSVADIFYKKDKPWLKTKKNTDKFYGIEGGKTLEWESKDAEKFRGGFAKYPCRNNDGKKNEEHRFESALLTELSKEKGSEKILKNIQPVRLAGSRFQMPTPFKASKGKPVYAEHKGGGIDLLCRRNRKLYIFELKDEYEDPINVLRQAVIYSVFIHKLLRTPKAKSDNWWNLFGFRKAPDTSHPLQINAVAALPIKKENDTSFAKKEIKVEGGSIQLHYFYFSLSKTDKVETIDTSF